MKIATVCLKSWKGGYTSENITGYKTIHWANTHIIFEMDNENCIAYHADNVMEISTCDA